MEKENEEGNRLMQIYLANGCLNDVYVCVFCRATSLHWNDQKESPANSEVHSQYINACYRIVASVVYGI